MDKYCEEISTSAEQLPSKEDLPTDLQVIASYYASQSVPRPSIADTERLLARLASEAIVPPTMPFQRLSLLDVLHIVRWRLRLLGPISWCAIALLLLLWTIAVSSFGPTLVTQSLIILLPALPIFGLGLVLRMSSLGLREIEASCPIGMVESTLGLTLVIVSLTCLLGGVATAGMALLHWASFMELLSAWLAPVVCLTALSLPIALRWGTRAAILVGGLPWMILAIVASLHSSNILTYLISVPKGGIFLLMHYAATIIGAAILLGFYLYGFHRRLPSRLTSYS